MRSSPLHAIKLLHTVAWAVFAGAIVVIPLFAWLERHDVVVALMVLVFGEIGVLLLNGMRCPLTDVAARYTDAREDNFDIYLPLWLARWNKWIFGSLFAFDVAFVLILWFRA